MSGIWEECGPGSDEPFFSDKVNEQECSTLISYHILTKKVTILIGFQRAGDPGAVEAEPGSELQLEFESKRCAELSLPESAAGYQESSREFASGLPRKIDKIRSEAEHRQVQQIDGGEMRLDPYSPELE